MFKYHIFGFGDPVIDIIAKVNYSFLDKYNIQKGSRRIISQEIQQSITSSTEFVNKELCTGGTTCNTITNISCLGGQGIFLGKISNDYEGNFFYENYTNNGIKLICDPCDCELATSSCIIMVTPDGERTMNTYIGASKLSCFDELKEIDICNSKLFYTEVYKLFDQENINTVFKGLGYAKKNKVTTAITCGDYTCINATYDTFMQIVPSIDIILGNEFEVPALLKINEYDMNLIHINGQKFANINNVILVMTMASQGSIIICPNRDIIYVEAKKIDHVVDATGAGDSFAAGFISGYINNLDIASCGKLGSIVATKVISRIGAVLNKQEDMKFINDINQQFNLLW